MDDYILSLNLYESNEKFILSSYIAYWCNTLHIGIPQTIEEREKITITGSILDRSNLFGDTRLIYVLL